MTREEQPREPRLAAWAWPNRGPALADKAAALGRGAVLDLVGSVVTSTGSQALLVKGAGLSHLYPSPWLRPMADLDLLVRAGDLEQIATALSAFGFTRQPSDRRLTEPLLEVGFHAPAPHQGLIELHTSMDKVIQRRIDIDAVFQRATASAWPGLLCPSLEDQVLFVTLHLASDEFRHTTGLVDLEVLIAAGANLQLVAERAREWQARTALYLTLRTFSHLLEHSATADRIVARLEPSRHRSRLLRTHFAVGQWPVAKRPTRLGLPWFYGQALLHDDPVGFMRKLSSYSFMRLCERLAMH